MQYRFDKIAFNSTAKKKPTEEDKEHYIGLEHLDSACLTVTRWGSDVAPTGEKLLMKQGDVLFGKRRAYQRKVGIAPFDGIFSAHGMVLRPNEEVIDKDFFPFFISSDQFMERAVRISVGGLSPTINWKDLREQEFNIPSLPEQKLLAEKLWAAYRLKESYKKLLAATDEMVKSRFIEMFKGCKMIPLKKVACFSKASINPIKGVKYTLFSFPAFDNNCIPEIVDGGEIKSSKLKLEENVILYNKLNVRLSRVWNINELSSNNNVCSSEFLPIKVVNKDLITKSFLYRILCSEDVTKKMVACSTGTSNSQKRISPASLLSLDIPIPSMDEQMKFVAIAEQADKSKFELRKSIDAIDAVIKSLINN